MAFRNYYTNSVTGEQQWDPPNADQELRAAFDKFDADKRWENEPRLAIARFEDAACSAPRQTDHRLGKGGSTR